MIKNYDLVIDYHPRKANVVADTLSRKFTVTLAHIRTTYVLLLLDMKTKGIILDYDEYKVTRLLYGSYSELWIGYFHELFCGFPS